MSDKMLGKIKDVTFGFGGYQDAQFGLSVHLAGDGWGTSSFQGPWANDPDEFTKWTKEDQQKQMFDTCWSIKEMLEKAKKRYVHELKGIPVEVTFEGNLLKSWRVLEEVL